MITNEGQHDEKYIIKVIKYSHQKLEVTSASASAAGTVTIAKNIPTGHPDVTPGGTDPAWTENTANAYIEENLNALYIHEGVLYGLITKQKGKMDTIYSTETSGEFAPYRFIAMKPDKLVIASDGYYGQKNDVGTTTQTLINKNRVFVFDIGTWSHPSIQQVANEVKFSKEIDHSSGSGFSWK